MADSNVETWNDDQAVCLSEGAEASRRQVRDLQGVYRAAEEVEEQGRRCVGAIDDQNLGALLLHALSLCCCESAVVSLR